MILHTFTRKNPRAAILLRAGDSVALRSALIGSADYSRSTRMMLSSFAMS
jgi:hypothetical protein